MSISGLVLTLSHDATADVAVSELAIDPRLTLGDRFGRRLAIVAETASVEADRDLWDRLRGTPGITNVDVAFVHLDADPIGTPAPADTHPVEVHHADH